MIGQNLSNFTCNYTNKFGCYIISIYNNCLYLIQIFRSWLWYKQKLRIGLFFFLYLSFVYGESFSKNPDEDKEANKKKEELKASLSRSHIEEVAQAIFQEGRILASEFEEQNSMADDLHENVEESKEKVVTERESLSEEEKEEIVGTVKEKLDDLFSAERRARDCLNKLEKLIEHRRFILQNIKNLFQNDYLKLQARIGEDPSIVGYLEWHVNRRQQKVEVHEKIIKVLEEKLEKYKKRQDSHEDKNNYVGSQVGVLEDMIYGSPGDEAYTESCVDTSSRPTSWSDLSSIELFEALSPWTTGSEDTTDTDEHSVDEDNKNDTLIVGTEVVGQSSTGMEDDFDDIPPLEGEEEEDAPSTSQHQLPPGNQAATSKEHSVSQPSGETQEKQEDKEEGSPSQRPMSLKRPRSDSSDGSSSPDGKRPAMLISGYSMGSQISSLQGLQCVLLTAVEQVTTSLKVLTLKALNTSKNSKFNLSNFQSKKYSEFGKQVSVQKYSTKKPIINRQERDNTANSLSLIHVFATTDSYSMNLESKVRSGQLGIVTNVVSDLFVGLAYDHNNSKSKEYVGVMLDSVVGSARAAMNTNALSAILIWNVDKTGFTGSIASYYSWGQMKSFRQYIHTQEIVSSKGTPNIMLGGGLIQLGYNFSIFKPVMFTPYVEYLFITTGWKEYDEVTGMLPSHISSTKDQLVSKSVGIRSCVNLSERSQIQSWVTGTFNQRKIGNITAQPLKSTRPMYKAVVKEYKKKNIQGEVGLSYEVKFTDNVKVGLSGEVQFERTKSLHNGNIRCFFQLRY